MKITVTQQHINQGVAGDWNRCALALAIREHYPDATVGVTGYTINWLLDGWKPLPATAIAFVEQFDNKQTVEPFEFDLT